MHRTIPAALLCVLAAAPAWSQGQAAPRPQIATTKVPGTENVYIFRNGNNQSIFVVTNEGVIATDPVAYGRPQGGATYIEEIKKVTDKPIKYLVYSHHHFDHITGGMPFKDAGAKIVAHKRVNERLAVQNDAATPPADETFDKKRTITLGGTALELTFVGLNHSDSTLVMRLPREKILFAVDIAPVGAFPGRGMIDSYPVEWEDTLRKVIAMDWDRLIPGHPGAPDGRLGTKQDVKDQLALLQEASGEIQAAARDSKCWEPAEKEYKMPKYEKWPGYEVGLPMLVRRYCGLWGRGT